MIPIIDDFADIAAQLKAVEAEKKRSLEQPLPDPAAAALEQVRGPWPDPDREEAEDQRGAGRCGPRLERGAEARVCARRSTL